jgi:hypothetical protein
MCSDSVSDMTNVLKRAYYSTDEKSPKDFLQQNIALDNLQMLACPDIMSSMVQSWGVDCHLCNETQEAVDYVECLIGGRYKLPTYHAVYEFHHNVFMAILSGGVL